jgi:hypothetical protein
MIAAADHHKPPVRRVMTQQELDWIRGVLDCPEGTSDEEMKRLDEILGPSNMNNPYTSDVEWFPGRAHDGRIED